MGYINKTVFINYLSCPTLGWLTKRGKLPRLSGLNNDVLILEGNNVHKKARELFPDAVNAQQSNITESAEFTKTVLEKNRNDAIIEAAFIADGFSARVDALKKLEDGSFHLFEVKSGSKYKSKYTNDIAFSAMVLSKSGINLSKESLLYLSHDYRLGMPADKLFSAIDLSEKAELKMREYLGVSSKAKDDIENDEMPAPYLKRACKNCPVFESCMGRDVQNSIFDLPRLSIPAMEELTALGVDTIDKVPKDFELTEAQQIVRGCVTGHTTYVSDNLKSELENLQAPYYYLDFESVTSILPLYPDVAPHTQLLTQFSIHKSETVGEVSEHFEFIADHTKNCSREIAEKLTEYLGDKGSIITYANFERVAIMRLALLYPDLCAKLTAIAERIVDFEAIVRKNYYDINFHGKSSIKKVLPVMVPEMSYKSLEIGEGGDASAAFEFMAMGFYDEKEIAETKANLLKYCAQDTLALVKIHKFLSYIIKNNE